MKQLRLLLAAVALIVGVGFANAQTDVTSTYIINADFSSTDGWTDYVSTAYKDYGYGLIGTYGVRTNEGQGVSTVDDTHLATEYCFGFEARWNGNYAAYQQTTAELPVGHYELSFDVENTNSSTTSANYDILFYVQVDGNIITDTNTEWMSGESNWTTHTIGFDVSTSSVATISLGYGTGSNNFGAANTPTLHVSHLKLTWADSFQAAWEALQAEIEKAKLCPESEGLADAIAAAETVLSSATTAEELIAALAALQEADRDAVLRYENGLSYASASNGLLTDFVVNGTFDNGVDGWTCTGGFQNRQTATNQEGDFTVPFFENWNNTARENKMYQTIDNIPNGTYKLKIAAFVNTLAEPNESQYVFANDDRVYLVTGEPTFYDVWTVVTENTIEIGLEQTSATANWMGIDNVSLTYYGAGDVRDAAQEGSSATDWLAAREEAQAALYNEEYVHVVGQERSALENEVAKPEPTTPEGYLQAIQELTEATRTFINAAPAYNGLWDEIFQAQNIGLSTTEVEELLATMTTTAAEVISATQNLKVQEYTTVTSKYTFDASHFLGSWMSSYDRLSGQDYADDGHLYYDVWSGIYASPTATQTLLLPAGNYVFMVLGRGQAGASQEMSVSTDEASYTMPFIMAGDTGLGTNRAGVTSFDPDDTQGFAFEGVGRGWQWRYITFTLDQQSDVTLTISGTINSQWLSWDAPRLLSIDEVVQPTDIIFADPVVENICLQRWDSDGDGKLSFVEAAAVTSLGNAFTRNASITSFNELKYFTGLGDLGDETFSGCVNLNTLILPSSLWRIGCRAFAGCTGMEGIIIPPNVVSFGYHAFSGCTSLAVVNSSILCPMPISATVFEGIAPDATLNVQSETGPHYQSTSGWNVFTNIDDNHFLTNYWPEDYQTVLHFVNTDSTIVTIEKRIDYEDVVINPDNTVFVRTHYALGLRQGEQKQTIPLSDDFYTTSFSNLWIVPCAVLDRSKKQLCIFASSKTPASNYAETGHAFIVNLNSYGVTYEQVFDDANWGWHSYFDCDDVEVPMVKHFSSLGYYIVQSTRNSDGTWTNEQTESIMPDDFTAQSIQHPQLLILDNLNIELEQDVEPVETFTYVDTVSAYSSRSFHVALAPNGGTAEYFNGYYRIGNGGSLTLRGKSNVFNIVRVEMNLQEPSRTGSDLTVSSGVLNDTTIDDVYSTSLTITSNGSWPQLWASSLTVTYEGTAPLGTYAIRLPQYQTHGAVTSDMDWADAGDEVTLTATPDAGYHLERLYANRGEVTLTPSATAANQFTFTMPAEDVTIGAVFAEGDVTTGILLNIPEDGETATNATPIYNLQGQRLTRLQRGVNIVSGRKMLK